MPGKCPCGARTSPDPLCDMCDGWQNDPNVGWGGFRDYYLGKDFSTEEEREEYMRNNPDAPYEDEEDC